MTKIYEIRNRIALHRLKKKTARSKTKRKTVSFVDAKKIGIIYSANKGEDLHLINEFMLKIKAQGKKIFILAYKENAKKEEFANKRAHETFLVRKNLSFWFEPRGKEFKEFKNQSFDILINLDLKEYICLGYLTGQSNAKFRIGKYSEKLADCHDFMINFDKEKGLRFFIEQVTHYLYIIKGENGKI
jgi:hypothetical protein